MGNIFLVSSFLFIGIPYILERDLSANTPNLLREHEEHRIAIFKETSKSVVNVTTHVVDDGIFAFNIAQIPKGAGSGIIWDNQGHIVTNNHLIRDSDVAQVTLNNNKTYEAKVIGTAPEKDLAVLRINAPKKDLKPLTLGTAKNLQVGQDVYAIGNPFGFDQSLTMGIISAIGREIETPMGTPIRNAIQTDAAINPGNSGGPLLDSSGRLIGINTAIFSPSGAHSGIGFATPVDSVAWVADELIKYGKISKVSLGATLASPAVSLKFKLPGALVLSIKQGSPAAEAGIRPTRRKKSSGKIVFGDVIVGIDDKPIFTEEELNRQLLGYQNGDVIKLSILRKNKRKTVKIKLTVSR